MSQFLIWTRNDNWTNSLIAMQVPFVRHIIPETDSGLVKFVVITNVFFNKQHGSFSSNISSLDSSATAEINIFIMHAKHEDLSTQKTKFSTTFGSSAS